MAELERLQKPVLAMYRRMLRLATRLPAADRAEARTQIRAAFRDNKEERNEQRIKELLDTAHKKLGYLKVITPRRPADAADELLGGAKRYIVHDGRVVEYDGKAEGDAGGSGGRDKARYSNWGPGNVDPAALARHNAQMKRFRFEDRPSMPRSPWDR